jgi:hypothetical protein
VEGVVVVAGTAAVVAGTAAVVAAAAVVAVVAAVMMAAATLPVELVSSAKVSFQRQERKQELTITINGDIHHGCPAP